MNTSLISDLVFPTGLAISGANLFVANYSTGEGGVGFVGEYTTAGDTLNTALITGLDGPTGIVVSGSNIFVANTSSGTIGEYTTYGMTVNSAYDFGFDATDRDRSGARTSDLDADGRRHRLAAGFPPPVQGAVVVPAIILSQCRGLSPAWPCESPSAASSSGQSAALGLGNFTRITTQFLRQRLRAGNSSV